MPDTLMIYKLIVMYILSRVNFSLTNAQISDFMLEKEYANFLSLQQAINELIDAGLLTAHTIRNRTHLSLTAEGLQTLNFFEGEIMHSIKKEIDEYLKEHEMSLRNETSILSDYWKAAPEEYQVRLIAKDREVHLIDLTLSVPTEETAVHICENWQKKNEEIYQYLISQLF